MSDILKILAVEATLNSTSNSTTANTITSARIVRILATANTLITVKDSGDNTVGSITVLGGNDTIIEKDRNTYLTANAIITAVPVGFRN